MANRIELVVVTSSTRNGEALKRFADHVDLVVGEANFFVERIRRSKPVEYETKMRGPDCGLVDSQFFVDPRIFEQVARQMFADELIVWHVGIECSDEIVAILVSVWNRGITFRSVRIRVAN